MGNHPSADLVYGVFVYDEDNREPLTALGICEEDDDADEKLYNYARERGLDITTHYSYEYGGYIINAKPTFYAGEIVQEIPPVLPEIDSADKAALDEIGKLLGRKPSWLLVPFYG